MPKRLWRMTAKMRGILTRKIKLNMRLHNLIVIIDMLEAIHGDEETW